ncbi:hypothetical protein GGE56_006575 [Rhizobium leguminosarum]|jgi:hypothetical protein|nr:hypothetical protein [Rhizobium leguminosarum]MBB6298234.1 hypothetical protein [Rhizobium leguminosarum]
MSRASDAYTDFINAEMEAEFGPYPLPIPPVVNQ